MARIAGRDMTASPSQLVARTITRDIEDGLKPTNSRISVLRDQGRYVLEKLLRVLVTVKLPSRRAETLIQLA